MFGFIKDKIFASIIKKSPVHKSAMTAGLKAIEFCPSIKLLRDKRPEVVERHIADAFERINFAIKNNNKFLLRESFCEVSAVLAAYMLLMPKSKVFHKNILKSKYLTGGWEKDLKKLAVKDENLKREIYVVKDSPDNPNEKYLKTFVSSKYEFALVLFEILNAARIELGDCNQNEKRDWGYPLLLCYCITWESGYYRCLNKKNKNLQKIIPHIAFPNIVTSGEVEPLFKWQETFPDAKMF